MSLILRYLEGRKAQTPLLKYPDLKLQKELKETKQDLNLILNKWKFGDTPIKSAQEFLNNFETWINKKIIEQGELKTFLEEQGASNLTNLKETWKNTEADYLRRIKELKESKEIPEEVEELKKEINELKKDNKQQGETIIGLNNSYDKLDKKYEELKKTKATFTLSEEDKEKLAEYEDLITERDEAIREQKTLEQQNLSLNNGLKLKQQEVSNKDKALEKLKKEKGELDKNLNKKITEKNTLITTLNQEIKQHKEKYSKQGKLLDTEQLECKRLEEENEKLNSKFGEYEEHIKELWEMFDEREEIREEMTNEVKSQVKDLKESGGRIGEIIKNLKDKASQLKKK